MISGGFIGGGADGMIPGATPPAATTPAAPPPPTATLTPGSIGLNVPTDSLPAGTATVDTLLTKIGSMNAANIASQQSINTANLNQQSWNALFNLGNQLIAGLGQFFSTWMWAAYQEKIATIGAGAATAISKDNKEMADTAGKHAEVIEKDRNATAKDIKRHEDNRDVEKTQIEWDARKEMAAVDDRFGWDARSDYPYGFPS